MYDIISIGSSVVDSFITSKFLKIKKTNEGIFLCEAYGEKIDVDDYIVRTGGGGNNTSVGFARMGFKTAVVTELGKDIWAQLILDELRAEKVATNLVISEKNEKTGGSIILLGGDGGRTIMVHRGAAAQLDPKDIPGGPISRAKWVHLSSISGQEKTLKFIFEVIRDAYTKLSWNPGNKELEMLVGGDINIGRVSADILFLNKHEWEIIEHQQTEILRKIPQVVITNGKHGGQIFINGHLYSSFSSKDIEAVDETGAGDAFIVGYLTAQIKEKSIEDSCEWGIKNAISVISQIGAKPGLLTITQMERHN